MMTNQLVSQEDGEDSNGRDLINQLLGQVQAAKAISQFSLTLGISKLAYIKESKTYKSLKGQIINGSELSGTWEEFCNLLGISVDKADSDIANLKSFGEEALESMSRMGIGYRDFAKYRKFPAEEKLALIEAAKAGDKEQLLDLAETLIERHVKDKSTLNEKLDTLEQDLVAAGKRANNMDAEIERQEMLIERLSKQQRITKFDKYTEDLRQESLYLQANIELSLTSLQKLFKEALTEAPANEIKLCTDQVFIALNAAVSRGLLIIAELKEAVPNLPERLYGQNILTPEEAERWVLDYQSLENAHSAAEAARQIKRDADQPRGRGRPTKAKA